jgi:hypothetical protein
VQFPAKGRLRDAQVRGDLEGLLEQGQGPGRVRVAVILRRAGEEGLQKMCLVFIQQQVSPPARLVLKGCRIVVLGVGLDPVVDGLPGDAEHAGDVGGGATMVELQDGQGLAVQARIPGLCELTLETSPLPGGQVEPAHGSTLHHSGCS